MKNSPFSYVMDTWMLTMAFHLVILVGGIVILDQWTCQEMANDVMCCIIFCFVTTFISMPFFLAASFSLMFILDSKISLRLKYLLWLIVVPAITIAGLLCLELFFIHKIYFELFITIVPAAISTVIAILIRYRQFK